MFVIVPPADICKLIHEQKVTFAREFGYKAALKPPVHITICPPFGVDHTIEHAFERQMQSIQMWAGRQPSFEILMDGYGNFPNRSRPALIINITQNTALQKMQMDFAAYLRKMKFTKCSSKYAHHLTIGYADIPPKAMPAITDVYAMRSFKASFRCDNLQLWRHNRINWATVATYKFAV